MYTSNIPDKKGHAKVAVLDGDGSTYLYYEGPNGEMEEIQFPSDWPVYMHVRFLKKKGFRIEVA